MDGVPSQVASYRIEGEIRRGPIATVYRAHDTLYERSVALKIVNPYFAQNVDFVRRFIAGGRDAMQLRHPHIAQVYEAGQAAGLSFVALELATGGTLADVLADWKGPAPASQVLIRVRQIALALEYAHSLGFVHANLKPSNILFDQQGEVKITDFGPIGQDGSLRLTGGPFGYPLSSPVFFSPEQASGEGGVDATTDIYALGIITYRLLCGVFPFDGANPLVMLRRVIEEEPPPPDAVNPEIEPHVASAIRAALSKDPSLRPRSAAAFMDGIDGRVTAQPVTFTPPVPHVRYTPAVASVPQVRAIAAPTAPRIPRTFTLPDAPRLRAASLLLRSRLPGLAVSVLGIVLVLLILLALARTLDVFDFTRREAGVVSTTPAGLVLLPTPTPSVRPTNSAAQNVAMRGPLNPPDPTATPDVTPRQSAEAAKPPAAPTATRTVESSEATATTPPSVQRTLPAARIVPTRVPSTATHTPFPTATPTWTPTHTPVPTATPLPTPTVTPSPVPTATPLAEIANSPEFVASLLPEREPSESDSVQSAVPEAPPPALTGRIAYSLWNPRTVRPDLYIWHVQSGVNSLPIANRRQPDFNLYNQLAANAEGNGMDNLIKMGTYGEDPWIISEHPEDAHPHWSPDGKMVVFDSANMGDRNHRIYLQRDTEHRSELPPMTFEAWELFGRYPIFVADGRVAYSGCNWWENGSVCGIYLVDTLGGKPSVATAWPGDIPTDNLGAEIIFTSDRGGNWDIYRMAADGTNLRRLTDSPAVEGPATVSPDGAYIAYLTNRDGVWAIYGMQSDGSNPRELVKLNGGFGSGEYDWLQERLSWGH